MAKTPQDSPAAGGGRPAVGRSVSVGRALAVYTGLRLMLFAIVFLLVQLFVEDTVLALGAAVLGSAVLSIPMLKSYRAELNAATLARTERRRAGREQA